MVENLENILKKLQTEREGKKVVLATGTFDLFHYEHLKYLENAKKQGDILVVAVKNNKCVKLKGEDRPIIDERHRIAIVDAIKYVDYTFLVDYNPNVLLEVKADNEKQEEWLKIFQETFKILRPDILYHEDNPILLTARERVFDRYGITGIKKARGKESSTTDIIKKISNL